MLDLSTVINDLLSGKAKLRMYKETALASAGTNLDENIFVCPANVLRLLLWGQIATTKTTATNLTCSYYPKDAEGTPGQWLYRSIDSTVLIFPISEPVTTKSTREMPVGFSYFFTHGDYIRVTHGFTAAETIAHTYRIIYIEWQMGKKPTPKEKIVYVAPPSM